MIAAWPEPCIKASPQSSGGPVDARRSFVPEIGEEIARPGTTARVERWSIVTHPLSAAHLATFETWFDADLAQGSLVFSWLHPVSGALRRFQFASAGQEPYRITRVGKRWVTLAFTALILPGEVPA